MPDSAATAKDLNTGVIPFPIGQSDVSFLHTDILSITHSNIPQPPCAGSVLMTSISDHPPVLESMNQYDVLLDLTNDSVDTGAAVPRTAQPAKHLATCCEQKQQMKR